MRSPREHAGRRPSDIPDRAARVGLLRSGAAALLLAVLALGMLGWVGVTQEGGADAIAALGGMAAPGSETAPRTLQLAAMADFVLIIGLGAGLCLLAAGFARDGATCLGAGAVVLFALLGAAVDLTENARILAGDDASQQTLLKFGALGVGGILVASLFPGGLWGGVVRLLGWLVVPISLAASASGLVPNEDPVASVVGLAAVLLILAVAALVAGRDLDT